MTFNPTNPTGWNEGDQITADQMNDLDSKTVDAVDGVGGGTYGGPLIFTDLWGIGCSTWDAIGVDANLVLRDTRDIYFENERSFVRPPTGMVGFDDVEWTVELGSRLIHNAINGTAAGWLMHNSEGIKLTVIGWWFIPSGGHSGIPIGNDRPLLQLIEIAQDGSSTQIVSYRDPTCATIAEYETPRLVATFVANYEPDPANIIVCRMYGETGTHKISGAQYQPPRMGYKTNFAIPR